MAIFPWDEKTFIDATSNYYYLGDGDVKKGERKRAKKDYRGRGEKVIYGFRFSYARPMLLQDITKLLQDITNCPEALRMPCKHVNPSPFHILFEAAVFDPLYLRNSFEANPLNRICLMRRWYRYY